MGYFHLWCELGTRTQKAELGLGEQREQPHACVPTPSRRGNTAWGGSPGPSPEPAVQHCPVPSPGLNVLSCEMGIITKSASEPGPVVCPAPRETCAEVVPPAPLITHQAQEGPASQGSPGTSHLSLEPWPSHLQGHEAASHLCLAITCCPLVYSCGNRPPLCWLPWDRRLQGPQPGLLSLVSTQGLTRPQQEGM